MLAIGTYPEVTLKDVRKKRNDVSDLLKQGIDPSQHRQEQKQQEAIAATNSFESVARLWWIQWGTARNKRYADYVIQQLEADVFPFIGGKPVTELTAPLLIMVIKKIESRGALGIAKKALTYFPQLIPVKLPQTYFW